MPGVSLKPSEHQSGGAVPVDMQLTWKSVRAVWFDYGGRREQPVPAIEVTYVKPDGVEAIQSYSAGSPDRLAPSEDGKYLVPVVEGAGMSTSSNAHILLDNLVQAGFPENRLDDDLTKLAGLVTYNIAIPEPKRPGLKKEEPVEGAREKVLSVPSKIIKLPWENKAKAGVAAGAAKPGKPAAPAAPAAAALSDVAKAKLVEVVGGLVDAGGGTTTRQAVAGKFFSDKKLASDAALKAVPGAVYGPAGAAVLDEAGFVLSGEDITRKE